MCKHNRPGWCWRALCWWWLALGLPGQAEVAQIPKLRMIGAEAGLPSSDIVGLKQDHAGDVWIATKDGLARYDGIDMTLWRHDPNNPASLPENRLQTLHIGVDGRIWIGSLTQGAAVLDPAHGGFIRYGVDQFSRMRSNSVLGIATEKDAVWLGTMDGLYKIADDGAFSVWRHAPDETGSLPGRIVIDLAFDADGVLWLATTGGLAQIGTDGRLHPVPFPEQDASPLIYSLAIDGLRLWLGTANGVMMRQPDGRWERPEWSSMFSRPNVLLETVFDPDGGLWLGSQRGAWRVPPGGMPTALAPTVDTVQMSVQSLLLQADGALWVPVYGQGLGYLRSDWRRVTQFARGTFALTGDRYHAISPAHAGGVWLLARNGAVEQVNRSGLVRRLHAPVKDRSVALAVDAHGVFWLGGQDRLLRVHQDGRIQRWQSNDSRDAALPGLNLAVIATPDGHLWVNNGTTGVQLRDAMNGEVLRNFLDANTPHSGFRLGDLEQMETGPDGVLWVAGVDGLARLDPENGVEGEAALRGARVLAFGFDGEDVLWLFRAHQLERFEHRNGQWTWAETIAAADGLPVLDPGGLRVDAQHRVWLSTPRGLYRWDPATRHVQHIGIQHGLQNQEFIERVLALDADGMLIGATLDGSVVMIDTRMPDPPAHTPRLNLRQIAVRRSGDWQPQWPPSGTGTALTLAHDEREFKVSMRLPYFDAPKSNRYWSKLEGYDPNWVAQGAQGDRIFSAIPPGHYTLHLRASDANGNPSAVHTLELHLQPPWWLGPGFRGVLLLGLVTLTLSAAALYRRRLHRRHAWQLAERERTLAEQASLAKTRFLATFGHEVRTPMTGVLGMSELLLDTPLNPQQQGYLQSIHHSGQHLLRLVNDALDLARIEAGRLELEQKPFALRQMLAEIAALQTPLASARGLVFECEIAPEVPPWVVGDGGRVRQILLNLLGNAVKFTERGRVGLRVRRLAEAAIGFEVSDTGPGLNAVQVERLFRRFEQAEGARTTARYGGSGLGLAISQELAAAMGGRIDVQSMPGQGTSFVVALPLPTATQADPPASVATPVPSLHVLLVEDDATVARVISGLLRNQGHRVVHVMHGLTALVEAAQTSFDLALLDLDLPGVDGLRLAGLLREQGFSAPLIAITARADAEAEPESMQAGFTAFIRKPLTGQMLAEVIAQGLGLATDE